MSRSLTSAVALRVLGEAADHRLHRLLQHRRVAARRPRPQPGSRPAVQAVELQRRRRRGRPGRSAQRGRRGQRRRHGDRHPGPERRAEGPARSRSESYPGLQPLRADAVREDGGFHCPHVTSEESASRRGQWSDLAPKRSCLKADRSERWPRLDSLRWKTQLWVGEWTRTGSGEHPRSLD